MTAVWGVRSPDDPDAIHEHDTEREALTAAGRCGQVMRRVDGGRWWPAYPPRRAPDVVLAAARRLADDDAADVPTDDGSSGIVAPTLGADLDVVLAYLLSQPEAP